LKSRSAPTNRHRSTPMLPHVHLGMFHGKLCFETFLVKFEDLSSYMRWTEEDRLFHLDDVAVRYSGMLDRKRRQ
jgi:hypothetical protein